eukprot:TRINITY_DN10152_c0_g1_i1.p1 TRINITY_DN10152_c0_g1~~TRINITY_DN10152_c0_g1_i1.p1  ORF type:complete len:497 (+),score=97.94 TRINITY_DN10152_c0_g1_i1:37-1527(+)
MLLPALLTSLCLSGKKSDYVAIGKQVSIGSNEATHFWMPKVLSFGPDVVIKIKQSDDGSCCESGSEMSIDVAPCHRECKKSAYFVTPDRGESYSELAVDNDDFCFESSLFIPSENSRRCPTKLIEEANQTEGEEDNAIETPKTTTASVTSWTIADGRLISTNTPDKLYFGPMIKGTNITSVDIHKFGPSLYADDIKQWFWLVGANTNETHLFKSTDGLTWDHVSKLPVLGSVADSSIARKRDDSLTVHMRSLSGRLLSITSRTMGKQWGKREPLPASRTVPTVISSFYTMASVGVGYASSVDYIRSSGKRNSMRNITVDQLVGKNIYTDDFLESDADDLSDCSELPFSKLCESSGVVGVAAVDTEYTLMTNSTLFIACADRIGNGWTGPLSTRPDAVYCSQLVLDDTQEIADRLKKIQDAEDKKKAQEEAAEKARLKKKKEAKEKAEKEKMRKTIWVEMVEKKNQEEAKYWQEFDDEFIVVRSADDEWSDIANDEL